MREKVAIRFAIEGDVRFISHHDSMRLFERALARADVPVRYSAGFNPRPKLSLPLPRPVGIATVADVLVVDLADPMLPAEVLSRLASQMPRGIRLLEAWATEGGAGLQPKSVTCELDLPAPVAEQVAQQTCALMAAESFVVQRAGADPSASKPIDVRAYLIRAAVEAKTLRWTAHVSGAGTLRPAELLATVGLDVQQWHHRIRRTQIGWQTAPSQTAAPTELA